jgi:hypothetical protein
MLPAYGFTGYGGKLMEKTVGFWVEIFEPDSGKRLPNGF